MFSNNRFEGSPLAKSGRKFGAERVKMSLGSGFFETLGFDQTAGLADLFRNSGYALRHRFELERQLPALTAEGSHLEVGVGNFSFETPGFAVRSCEALFGLRQ